MSDLNQQNNLDVSTPEQENINPLDNVLDEESTIGS